MTASSWVFTAVTAERDGCHADRCSAPAVVAVWAAWALFGPDGRIEPDDNDADYEHGD